MAIHTRLIKLQPRDLEFLQGLYESRIVTRQHIADIYFGGKSESAKKRIQKLLAAGLISEQPSRPNEPKPISVAKSGFDLLSESGALTPYPQQDWRSFQKRVNVSEAMIRHELEVMSVKAAFIRSIRELAGLSLVEFSTWPKLYEFRARRPITRDGYTNDREVLMKPDGFIRIHQDTPEGTREHCFSLELDRGSETLGTVASKILGYRHYYQTGAFAERMGCDPQTPTSCPFRVLVIAKSDRRIQGFARQLMEQRPPIQTLAWLANYSAVMEEPMNDCWSRPVDFLAEQRNTSKLIT